jgi:tetratricopeptide (TPR) repeat protein
VPDTVGEARFFAYRASLLLTVGRFDQASRDLERALSLNPNYSEALALQAIVAVAQNEKERARELAQQAVTADPNSASALIALSYAQQANFDLDGALATIQRAVQVSPENALAWARLAELQLSFAELKDALDAAEKAVSLDPNLSRTQSVLGFAFLTRVNTDQAKRAFERAIELDQADPLPRLGLGLAKIREGDLEEGRREIEIAVSLDPDNALTRSYLGKAYFEEKRDKQASDQYQMSKQLDPRDPTPYFYDAIRKQTTNRPVEALHDMQRAIELNDNRVVYRSRLLLDADLAARSAALSRIYSDLGFQQLALVEGWKSVNTDPTNFSAHRFLADSYSVLPRHEIARVSELLQSQLLQPLNMTPIQPHLGESNLFLISAGGPAALSFNEFNPLFNRNGFNFQSTGVAGENSTYAGENVLSGIYNKTAFSLGGFHFQTDGWRKNADQQDTIANAFVQFEPTTQTSIQAEFRYRDKKQGDIQQRFFSQDFSRRQQDTAERFSIRFSGRHATSPDSIFVGSFMFQDENAKLRDPFPIPPVASFRINRPEKAHNIELQNLFRHVSLNLTTGLGYFDTNATARTALVLPFPPPIVESFDEDVQHFNAYTYANINLVKNLTITAGASVDNLRGPPSFIRGGNDTRFNPKFGITWTPFLGTSVRAAAFHIVKRTLITDQTLEPTQVAGFAQFFDDLDATKAWRYGVGVDQKITKEIFGGSEFSFRNLRIPVTDDPSLPPTMADGREYLARTYLFWTPNNWLATRIEYNFERFKHELAALPAHVNTHSVPLGLTFFHPSGLSAAVNATYFRQTGNFNRLSIGRSESGSDDFWIVDAALSYRLPNRYGFLRLGVTNLFDKRFRYFEMDLNNSRIQPTRMAVFKIILTLP